MAEKAKKQLESLKEVMEAALVQQIADDFIDITTPLKHLTDAAHAPANDRNRLNNFVVSSGDGGGRESGRRTDRYRRRLREITDID